MPVSSLPIDATVSGPPGILERFHPAVRVWFERRFPDGPTEAQVGGWPAVAAGQQTLICAPTGSGKTLAGFLAAIDALYRAHEAGSPIESVTRVVYLSPLKALAARGYWRERSRGRLAHCLEGGPFCLRRKRSRLACRARFPRAAAVGRRCAGACVARKARASTASVLLPSSSAVREDDSVLGRGRCLRSAVSLGLRGRRLGQA